MPAKKATTEPTIYQLKITLRDSKPPIWRRVQVSGTTSLARVHDIIQIVMGWTNSHLHQFVVDGQTYSDPLFELDDTANEKRTNLGQLALASKSHFEYQYDFGDSWEHDLVVEKILAPEPGVAYPRCLAGKLACPPDDCGGIWGYFDLLEIIQDPDNPERDEMLDWLGGEFDPEVFDMDAVNKELSTHLTQHELN